MIQQKSTETNLDLAKALLDRAYSTTDEKNKALAIEDSFKVNEGARLERKSSLEDKNNVNLYVTNGKKGLGSKRRTSELLGTKTSSKPHGVLYQQAIDLLDQYQPAEAIHYLDLCVEQKPNKLIYRVERAETRLLLLDPKGALDDVEISLNFSQTKKAKINLLAIQAQALGMLYRHTESISVCKKVLKSIKKNLSKGEIKDLIMVNVLITYILALFRTNKINEANSILLENVQLLTQLKPEIVERLLGMLRKSKLVIEGQSHLANKRYLDAYQSFTLGLDELHQLRQNELLLKAGVLASFSASVLKTQNSVCKIIQFSPKQFSKFTCKAIAECIINSGSSIAILSHVPIGEKTDEYLDSIKTYLGDTFATKASENVNHIDLDEDQQQRYVIYWCLSALPMYPNQVNINLLNLKKDLDEKSDVGKALNFQVTQQVQFEQEEPKKGFFFTKSKSTRKIGKTNAQLLDDLKYRRLKEENHPKPIYISFDNEINILCTNSTKHCDAQNAYLQMLCLCARKPLVLCGYLNISHNYGSWYSSTKLEDPVLEEIKGKFLERFEAVLPEDMNTKIEKHSESIHDNNIFVRRGLLTNDISLSWSNQLELPASVLQDIDRTGKNQFGLNRPIACEIRMKMV
jgi:tetratricopeptide (TPR) repeat protein